LEETERSSLADSPSSQPLETSPKPELGSSSELTNDEAAQIDPRDFAPVPLKRLNSDSNRIGTVKLFVLFEYCLEHGLLNWKFFDSSSTIWKVSKFENAVYHSDFLQALPKYRKLYREDHVLRNRLLKQHWEELDRMTYPLPKRRSSKPQRKRGYSDKGSTRPNHQKFRTDSETQISVFFEDLHMVEKVVVYGRRPTVTYRRLPYSEEIGRCLDLNLLVRVGDLLIPVLPTER
jgi:hypothetical protein